MVARTPRAPTVRFPPVGRCIYCGTTEGRLTEEHILPFGLHGNFVLPEASCDACAEVTAKVEGQVLRGFLERGRLGLGLGSRHKKRKRPTSLPTTLISPDGSVAENDLPILDSVQVIHLPVFIPPLILGGVPKYGDVEGMEIMALDTLHIGDAKRVMREHAAVGIRFEDRMDTWAFIRMLAKIAHGFHIAQQGWFPQIESPVLPVIMGTSNLAMPFIGCLESDSLVKPGSNALHLMDIHGITGADGSVCTVVRIKLFAPALGPTYAVVTRLQAKIGTE